MAYDYSTAPFRLRIQIKLCEVLESITPANGYQTDLSETVDEAGRPQKRVYRGRDQFGDNDPLPMVSILEDPRIPEGGQEDQKMRHGKYRLLLQGFVDDDAENPTDAAYYLAAEIVQRLAEEKQDRYNILGFGGRAPCITEMTFGSPVVRPADNVTSDVAFCFVPVSLEIAENIEQPFA